MRISDWSSDVCSSDLRLQPCRRQGHRRRCEPKAPGLFVPLVFELVAVAREPARVAVDGGGDRSEERRVGKELVSTCRSRWSTHHSKQKLKNHHLRVSTTHTINNHQHTTSI